MSKSTCPAGEPSVQLQGIGHHFLGQPWLFRGLDQIFLRGRSYALTGPSGSGKSTLLSLISGWEKPKEGSVLRASGGATSWVFQNPHGVRNRTALDHVVLPLLAQGFRRSEAVDIARTFLDTVALGEVSGRRFSELSGGEAQRLMLARGLVGGPDILLVDEPTAQLDFATATTINQALMSVKKNQSTVIVATHDERTRDACDEHVDLSRYAVGREETYATV